MNDLTLSVIVPAYNEAGTVEQIVARLHELPLRLEVIAVNDASQDGTGAVLDRMVARGALQQIGRAHV